jgi:hypothetical protein
MTCTLLDPKNSSKFPINTFDNIGNFLPSYVVAPIEVCENMIVKQENIDPSGLCTLGFDRTCNKNGNGIGILLVSRKVLSWNLSAIKMW